MEFDGAVSVVTGAGGGIGREIAFSLARRGGRVVVADIEQDAAEAVAAELVSSGAEAVGLRVDVTDAGSVAALAAATVERHGGVDLLCNNAGAALRPFRATWDGSFDDFRWMMDVNYFGTVHCLLAFLPLMRGGTRRRHIVNVSSMATLDEVVGNSMYTAAKNAVNGLSDVLRAELAEQGEDIGLTVLMPGQVTTRIGTSERLRPQEHRSDARAVPEYQRSTARRRPPIAPDEVGELLVAAISANEPYCLTHAAPADRMRERADEIVAGYAAGN
jgi:NAD(P)-dependent dehydrogenase (short-subunit alcohol dehydrogenase family)